jgi:HlyD family type I secretion membrane fusion protein
MSGADRAPGPTRHMLALEEVRLHGPQRALMLGVAALVATFVGWASVAVLPESAVALGEVTTEVAAAPVQHLEGGIVAAVLVSEGDRVRRGQPILRMDATAAASEHAQQTARLATLDMRAARLAAFVAAVSRPGAAPGLAAAAGASASAEAPGAAALAARLAGLAGRLAVAEGALAQTRAEAAALVVQTAAAEVEVDLARAERETREALVARGLATRLALLEARRLELAAEGAALRLTGARAAADAAVAEAEARLAEIRATAIDEAEREAAAVAAERAEVGALIARLADRLTRTLVRAPADGTVRGLAAPGPGGVLPPGALIAELLPEGVRLVVDVDVGPRDIGFIRTGQPADIRLTAFDHARYGVLPGVVERISAGAFVDEQGRPHHRVRLGFAAPPTDGPASRIAPAPGMAVEAGIRTGDKTVMQYLLKPLFAYGAEALRER